MKKIFDINIYSTYNVSIKNQYSYYNEDGDIIVENENFTKDIDGGKLIDLLVKSLSSRDISSFEVLDFNKFYISLFCPFDGTGQDLFISLSCNNENHC